MLGPDYERHRRHEERSQSRLCKYGMIIAHEEEDEGNLGRDPHREDEHAKHQPAELQWSFVAVHLETGRMAASIRQLAAAAHRR
jgi:hypothetical protein